MPQLKPLPKFILIAAVVGGLFFAVNHLASKGFLGSGTEKSASVPERIDLPGSVPGRGAERIALDVERHAALGDASGQAEHRRELAARADRGGRIGGIFGALPEQELIVAE